MSDSLTVDKKDIPHGKSRFVLRILEGEIGLTPSVDGECLPLILERLVCRDNGVLDVPFVHPVNLERVYFATARTLFGDMEASSLRSLVPE